MPQTKAWKAKRERQVEHDRRSLQEGGGKPPPGDEPCADPASPQGAAGLRQLLKLARERGVKGRSTMNKAELEQALKR